VIFHDAVANFNSRKLSESIAIVVRPDRSDRAGIIAALIQSAMRCRSVACGTARSTRSRKSNNPVTFSVQRWAEIGTILCHQEANIRMTTKGNRYEYRSGFDQT
jgi:hypothetical protein